MVCELVSVLMYGSCFSSFSISLQNVFISCQIAFSVTAVHCFSFRTSFMGIVLPVETRHILLANLKKLFLVYLSVADNRCLQK